MKVGVLGGTFDPVHRGHLQLAEMALGECSLDKVLFIPSAHPPHKDGNVVTSFAHRVAMLRLASKDISLFECDLIEERLPKPSYTIDTLKILENIYHDRAELFFILGADAFLDIATWKAHDKLLRLVNFILSLRKGYQLELVQEKLQELGYSEDGSHRWGKFDSRQIHILKSIPTAISSSSIRAMIARGESVNQFVPENVEEYIMNHGLYRQHRDDRSQKQ
ncbi:MAG: nicotinate-nucleotide adenylyltransferase [Desulforhopalus sp.]